MKILVAGDYCPQYRVAELFEKEEYDKVLCDVRKLVGQYDYTIVNFECPVIKGNEAAIHKNGPNLFCSRYGVTALKWAGFNCVTLANNHFSDYGESGIKETILALKEQHIDYVGGGLNISEASQILYKKINGEILAIINCCEHEFSIASDLSAGSNPLNPIQQYYAIKEARKNADYVLVIVHGGHEHFQLPSPRMIETYRFFVDAGADAVVNHHQHCFSGYEIYNNKPIFYGLGNFCFDEEGNTGGIWNEGYLVHLSFDDTVKFSILPYNQCDKEPKVSMLPLSAYEGRLSNINKIIGDREQLSQMVENYYNSCQKQNSYIFEPFIGRLFTSLRYRGLLPSLVSKKRKMLAFDFIGCESHRDKILSYLSCCKK